MGTDGKPYVGSDPSVGGFKGIGYSRVAGDDDEGQRHDEDHGEGRKYEDVSPAVVKIRVKNTTLANIYAINGTVGLKEEAKGT